jgi:MFS family permease
MLSISIVFVVSVHTGSYVAAGAATACAALGAVLGAPVAGRAADRFGAATVVLAAAVADATAMTALVLAVRGDIPLAVFLSLALCIGAFAPPIGPVLRASWPRLFPEPDLREAAYAFESVTLDVVFIIGPLLASAVALWSVDLTLLAAAVLTLVSSALLVRRLPDHPPEAHSEKRDWRGPLRSGRVVRLLPITFLIAGSIIAIELAAIASADEHGSRAAGGALIAALSVGSIAGGLYWGSRRQPGSPAQQIFVLAGLLGMMFGLLALAPGLLVLGVGLGVAGTALAPLITAALTLMNEVAPPGHSTEAFAWLGSTTGAGAAASAASTGAVIAAFGGSAAFLAAGAFAVAAAALAFIVLRAFADSPWPAEEVESCSPSL